MLDFNSLFTQALGTVSIVLSVTVTIVISYKYYFYDREIILYNRVAQVEAARLQQGLPSDLQITPEDLRLNPELADILGITDVNSYIDVTLETNAHLEYYQHQETLQAYNNFIASTVEFLSGLIHPNFLESITNIFSLFT